MNDPRVAVRRTHLLVLLAAGALAVPLLVASPASTAAAPRPAPHRGLTVTRDVHHDLSAPLRSLPPARATARRSHPALGDPRPAVAPSTAKTTRRQGVAGPDSTITPPQVSFEGIGTANPSAQGGTPSDQNSDVGTSQIVEVVNSGLAVYSKAGATLLAPGPTNTLWSGFGGPCQTHNDGDAIVRYDQQAGRWVIIQFALPTIYGEPGPNYECMAVSTTGDATGTYARYSFPYSDFPDYAKMGVWSDGYYITYNMFDPTGSFYTGDLTCALDRTAILAAQPATQQCVNLGTNEFGVLPSDLDGPTPPPTGAPNIQLSLGLTSTTLHEYAFHVDWATPANTQVTGPTNLTVASYSGACSSSSSYYNCIPQPSPGHTLDSLGDRLMYPLLYRNSGGVGSLVVSHTVTTGSAAGERWYQLRVGRSGSVSVAQQGTYSPADGLFRFMGSVAMDHAGNLALGYSGSSGLVKPEILYTGRLAGDPAGTMTQAEKQIQAGAGVEQGSYGRWGDYTSMVIDPTDDCTFWYTNQYFPYNGQFSWNTRIASFRFPDCGVDDFSLAVSPAAATTSGGQAVTTVTTQRTKGTARPVALTLQGLPSGASATFGTNTVSAGSSTTLTVTAGTAAPGTYGLTVVGQEAGAQHSVAYTLTIGRGFHVSLAPASGTAGAAHPASTTVSVTPNGTAEQADLTVTGLPPGATATFTPATVTTGHTSTLSLGAGTAAEGSYPLTVTGTSPTDATDHASATYTLKVDRTGPTAALTAPARPFVLASTTSVKWTGSDAGSGVRTYDLRSVTAPYSADLPPWPASPQVTGLTTTSRSMALTSGSTSCFEVRGVDSVGNVGAWSAARCTAEPLDDRALAASSQWHRTTGSAYWRHTLTVTSTKTARLTRSHARVSRIAVVATRCPSCGRVAVYVGTHKVGTVDLAGTTSRRHVFLLPTFAALRGTVVVKVLTANKSVGIDGLGLSSR